MPEQLEAILVVETGIRDTNAFPLRQTVCLLGNGPAADIVLDNPYVSRLHARIVQEGGQFRIRDLGSKNGTCVNGARLVDEGKWLTHGDRIDLAQGQVVLRLQEQKRTLTVPIVLDRGAHDVVVDAASREVWVRDQIVDPPISRKEFDVLHLLYQRAGEACSRDEIAAAGWPERGEGDVTDQEIDQCIRRLRLRIEADSSQPHYIVTVRGYGYRLSHA